MIFDFLRTLLLSIKRFFTNDSVIASEEIVMKRMNICKQCVYLTGTNIVNYKCKLCKCYLLNRPNRLEYRLWAQN